MPIDYAQKWQAFIGVAFLSFGCYLDYTVVNVALPTIQQQFSATLTTLQWVMNIYFLTLCTLATIMGKCGDFFGKRRCFYLGVGIFAIASIVAGVANNMHWLILGRLLQGIGAAIVFPVGLALLAECFPEHERAKIIAWFGSLGGIALALGPLLGGLIVAYLGWRWIFFINIPMMFIGILFCFRAIKESPLNPTPVYLDWTGMFLLALTMSGVVLGIIHGQSVAWRNILTLTCLFIGSISGIFLVVIEMRKEHPLIDFKDFNNILFFAGALLVILVGTLSAISLFFDPLYLQVIRRESAQLSGFVLFAIPLAVFVFSLLIGKLVARLGILHTLNTAFLLAALACLMQFFFTPAIHLAYVIITFLLLGCMWAIGNTVTVIAAQMAVGPSRASGATGTMVTLFNVGGSIGLAIGVGIYNFTSSLHLHHLIQRDATQLNANDITQLNIAIANPSYALQSTMSPIAHNFFAQAFLHGLSCTMFIIMSLTLLMGFSIFIKNRSCGGG